ncbi:hypothetical protein O987_26475 [Comamonas testosteroni TK102]|uniref:ABC transporter substrate-binding protein n=2 Tax=Comamonadaceae TaxID=80864 RepID=A0A076PXB7_COMTE|nr:hypothetical protein O987_26475 [Comamonas testosteroni TK102]MPS89319.1 tripartite tricarboxylate transporter substrate binding protein [Comamonas sp.]
MSMTLKKSASFCALAVLLSSSALAQAFPSHPITIVVPYNAGGASDGQVRMMSEALSRELGQPIVVENKPGASGALGAIQVARSKADGHTLLFPNNGVLVPPLLSAKAGFDPFKDFKPIGLVSTVPMVLVTNKTTPATDVKSFLSYARSLPGGVMYASAGPASFGHLTTMRFAMLADIKVDHVPYKGEAGTTMAARTGEVQMLLTTPSAAMLGQIHQGNLRLLGTATPEPSPVVPDAPLLSQSVPGFTAEAWFGLLAPAGTPDSAIEKINLALHRVLSDKTLKAKFLAAGAVVKTSTPAEFNNRMQQESKQMREVITKFNIKAE